jgi:hypothetical protein
MTASGIWALLRVIRGTSHGSVSGTVRSLRLSSVTWGFEKLR